MESIILLGLFLSIFLSYSILPFFTEAPIIAAIKIFNPLLIFVIALIAASLGGVINYYIGLKGIRRFIPKKNKIKKAESLFKKYGVIALVFLAWLPYIGDPIIITAGILRMPFLRFLLYSSLGRVWYLGLIVFLGVILF